MAFGLFQVIWIEVFRPKGQKIIEILETDT